jgi:hypothetical protein
MKVNADKTKAMHMTFSRKDYQAPAISVDGKDIELVDTFKLLGVVISADLTWGAHVDYIHEKCARRLYLLVLLKRAGVSVGDILRIYVSMFRSVMEYACPVWHTSLTAGQTDKLESIQRCAFRILHPELSYAKALVKTGELRLSQRREDFSISYCHRSGRRGTPSGSK